MLNDALSTLGLDRQASHAEARAAFRRLAMLHHPDRNPGDSEAAERFKAVLAAYRRLSRHLRSGASRGRPRAGPRPDRFECGACGDRFPFPEICARCDVVLHDRDAGPVSPVERPGVQAMMADLLSRPEPEPVCPSPRVPGYLVGGCLTASALVWQVGPAGPALLFAGFAAYVAGVEVHRRALASMFG